MFALIQQIPAKEITVTGIVIPAVLFLFSFAVTYWLYRHFSKHEK